MADQIGEILYNAFDKILADNDMKRRTICFISYKMPFQFKGRFVKGINCLNYRRLR